MRLHLRAYGHCKRVCTQSWYWKKNPLLQQGIEPELVLHLAFPSDALPSELSPIWATYDSGASWHKRMEVSSVKSAALGKRTIVTRSHEMSLNWKLGTLRYLHVSNLQVLLDILILKSHFYSKKMWMWRVSEGCMYGGGYLEKSALKLWLCIE